MSIDNEIGYEYAGPGAKRRQRLRLADIPKRMSKAQPHRQRPRTETRKVKEDARSEGQHSVIGIKTMIRTLVIDRDASVDDIEAAMKRDECPVSRVTIGNVRAECREILKLLGKEGLLKTNSLARRRKNARARDTD